MPTDYQSMPMASLIDLLAVYTEKYTQLLALKAYGDEYNEYKRMILQIIEAIEVQKGINSTDSSSSYPSKYS